MISMERRILSADLLKLMSMFENITRVSAKDCFENDATGQLVFIVPEGQLGRALGKGAQNIKKLSTRLNKKVRVLEYKPDVKSFIKSLLLPLTVGDITEVTEGVYQIEPQDTQSRGLIIGRSGANLRNLEKMVRRFFNAEEIKVA